MFSVVNKKKNSKIWKHTFYMRTIHLSPSCEAVGAFIRAVVDKVWPRGQFSGSNLSTSNTVPGWANYTTWADWVLRFVNLKVLLSWIRAALWRICAWSCVEKKTLPTTHTIWTRKHYRVKKLPILKFSVQGISRLLVPRYRLIQRNIWEKCESWFIQKHIPNWRNERWCSLRWMINSMSELNVSGQP